MAVSEIEAKRAALKASPLFRCLQPAEFEAVLSHSITRRFARGSMILRKADPGTGMIVVLSGRVRIAVTSEEGKEITLAILGPGELLGELSLIDGETRSADAIALEESVVLRVERIHYLRLLHDNADLCMRLMAVLCGRLRKANAALEDLVMLDLPGRLGRLLTRLASEYGVGAPGGTRIAVKFSQKDLGTIVSGSREQVNRQLRQWEQEGVIAQEKGYLVVKNPDRLTGSGEHSRTEQRRFA